jgi:hypothetical protein
LKKLSTGKSIARFSLDLHARYFFEEPRRMSFNTIDGLYKDTYAEFELKPFDEGSRTFVFATVNVMLERDESLTMRIVKSGPFPFQSTINMSFSRDLLNAFKLEAEQGR